MRLDNRTTAHGVQLGLGSLGGRGLLTGPASGLNRLQRQALEVRLAQVLGAARVTPSLTKELLFEGPAGRRGTRGSVLSVGPARVRGQ